MVEIVNPGDLGKEVRVVDGDLIARAVKASAQCGPCDFGLVEFGCSCKDGEDPRAVIVDLIRAVEQMQQGAGKKISALQELVVEARGLLMRAREIALRSKDVHPLSPYVQGVQAWLEKEGRR